MGSIDLVVPCYNYGRYLTQCVGSALAGGVPETRILIIDDCSSDDTAEVGAALANADPRVTFRRHTVNQGHIRTYNEGLEWASADYALILSADDWVLPGALGRAVELLDARPDAGFAYGPALCVKDGAPMPPEAEASPRPGSRVMNGIEFLRSCAYCNQVATCTAVVRTALQKEVGDYLEELPHAGDLEIWMRLARLGPVGYVNAYQGVYRQHAVNMSIAYYHRKIRDFQQRRHVLALLFSEPDPALEEIRGTMWRGLAEAAMHEANVPFKQGDLAQFDELRDFAASVYPGVRKMPHWRIQTMKRVLGPRLCSNLQLVGSQLRRAHPAPERQA